jgi:hypothetical protein
MAHRILALWATPRTVSTAFERMMIERGDHEVFDEPFSATYYFSPERSSKRFDQTLANSRASEVMDSLRTAACRRPVFFKDMAYQAAPYLGDIDLNNIVSSFLVRDPRWVLPSLHRMWPDFSTEGAGYGALLELFTCVRNITGRLPVVVDSDALRRTPEPVVRAWCDAVRIPFVASAMTWAPGMQRQWRLWQDWYEDVARSRGFLPPKDADPPVVRDQELRSAIEDALPIYEELVHHSLRPEA